MPPAFGAVMAEPSIALAGAETETARCHALDVQHGSSLLAPDPTGGATGARAVPAGDDSGLRACARHRATASAPADRTGSSIRRSAHRRTGTSPPRWR